MRKKYDIIYSIGRDCACATYMIKAKLRSCSGPFDWLTNAGFEDRFDLLINNFKDFMNISDFEFLPKDPNVFNDPKCDYYKNNKTNFFYYHDFPIGVPFNEVFYSIAEKYNRRIQRFYEKINKSNKVLLIWFSHYHNTPDNVVLTLCNKFCEKMGKQIDFLIIEHKEGIYQPESYMVSNNITRYFLHTQRKDANGSLTTLGNEELICPIFNKYKLIVPWYLMLSRFSIKFLIKFICLFIPIKKWRKKLKKIYKGN